MTKVRQVMTKEGVPKPKTNKKILILYVCGPRFLSGHFVMMFSQIRQGIYRTIIKVLYNYILVLWIVNSNRLSLHLAKHAYSSFYFENYVKCKNLWPHLSTHPLLLLNLSPSISPTPVACTVAHIIIPVII